MERKEKETVFIQPLLLLVAADDDDDIVIFVAVSFIARVEN